MEIDSMYSHVAKWDSRNTVHSRHYLMKKQMPKFYQDFFAITFNESTDTKTTVQTRDKSLYSSYNLRRPQSFQKSHPLWDWQTRIPVTVTWKKCGLLKIY